MVADAMKDLINLILAQRAEEIADIQLEQEGLAGVEIGVVFHGRAWLISFGSWINGQAGQDEVEDHALHFLESGQGFVKFTEPTVALGDPETPVILMGAVGNAHHQGDVKAEKPGKVLLIEDNGQFLVVEPARALQQQPRSIGRNSVNLTAGAADGSFVF